MTKLKHTYYLVEGHLGEDYFEKVTDDPNQEDFIQETCDECGDSDWIKFWPSLTPIKMVKMSSEPNTITLITETK